jgi:4'-phosphopantetheinyl transferase
VHPVATDAEVHVWRVSLDSQARHAERLADELSEDERSRADRFRFEGDRRRYHASRGTLRAILSRYVRFPPREIVFVYSVKGKPSLPSRAGECDLRFNLSHAGGIALVAVALGRDVGVDIECIRDGTLAEEIGERFFAPAEVAAMRELPPAERSRAFFHCWTRKEAYLKARGEGVSLPLRSFQMALAPGDPAALLATPDDPRECSRWSLQDLAPGCGYAAAVAVAGHGWQLRLWDWPG